MKTKQQIHVLSHTHWDREWFLSVHYTREWLIPFFDSLFQILESEVEAKFILDGQLLMAEDYFQLLEERGRSVADAQRRISTLVRKGQIILGPYYLQPDWQLISEESAVRNLLAGKRLGEKLGPIQNMGWLLDCFGQIAQMPQIHAGFNLEGIFVWRGVGLEPSRIKTEFLWESPDGTAIPASYLLDSYRNAMRINWDPAIVRGRMNYIADKLAPYSSTSNLLFMNGYDQEMEPENLPALLRANPEISARASSPEDYMKAVLSENPELDTVRGALYSGRYISVFPGTLSARMPLKQRNHYGEKLLERYVEPLLSLAAHNGMKYPREELQSLWLELMKNHPHDTICGVSIDALYRDFTERCNHVDRQNQIWIGAALGHLLGDGGLSFYNPSGCVRHEVVEVPLKLAEAEGRSPRQMSGADAGAKSDAGPKSGTEAGTIALLETGELAGAGMTDADLAAASEAAPVVCTEPDDIVPEYILDNGIIQAKILPDGRLHLRNKKENVEFHNLHYFEDGADAGDTYNYSPCHEDKIINSKGTRAKISVPERGPLRARIRIDFVAEIPARLTEDRHRRETRTQAMPISTIITLKKGSARLEFQTRVSNTARDHRLRVCFPTGLKTEISHADTQFAVTPHPIDPPAYSDEGLSPELKKILLGAREPSPISCFPQRQFVDVSDGEKGLAVLNKGLPEYEVQKDQRTVALTLFRSVGWLARTDLLERIGDAGPQIATPRAQVLESMHFEYALYPHRGDWEQSAVPAQAECFDLPVLAVAGRPSRDHRILPAALPPQLKWTAYKNSEDGKGEILRLANYSEAPCHWNPEIVAGWQQVNMAEEPLPAEKAVNRDSWRAFEVKTFRRELPADNKKAGFPGAPAPGKPAFFRQESAVRKPEPVTSGEPLVEKTEADAERERWQTLEQEIRQVRKAMKTAEKLEHAELELKLYTLERASLEARISYVYLEESLRAPNAAKDTPEIEALMHEIGLKLNHARVNKRTFEYIYQYYQDHPDYQNHQNHQDS
ncbi:glycoside hydrolase family 38 C-terminal domain-containing protein [Candidatus Haliotispira prima]|uniref:Glycoside hydrolase family 38 C-terminal domain-containing protein n=1 Tax=Candidatus Haliotispira prima TaxID=3034016 RepID=A0ABY8MES9_9SPIO|nr:glycoside hydrolase family 38 C-terminal domain-containing protein [Candidatus Haliotispira prima]